jgi:hypothetical protein
MGLFRLNFRGFELCHIRKIVAGVAVPSGLFVVCNKFYDKIDSRLHALKHLTCSLLAVAVTVFVGRARARSLSLARAKRGVFKKARKLEMDLPPCATDLSRLILCKKKVVVVEEGQFTPIQLQEEGNEEQEGSWGELLEVQVFEGEEDEVLVHNSYSLDCRG